METPDHDKLYQIIPGNGYTTLRLTGELVPEKAKAFESDVQSLFREPFVHVIVNCEYLSEITKPWLRVLLLIASGLNKVGKEFRFILVSQKIKDFFRNEGVDKAFKISSNLRDALVEFGLITRKHLDTDFINPFLSATMEVLKVQANTESKSGKIYVKQEKKHSGDISGVIGIVSESFNGTVVISFPEATFLKIISRMLGENYTELTQEIIDGASELTNMVVGQAKAVLNVKGYGIKTALPSVVTGKDHNVSSLTQGPIVVVPFDSDVGSFFIEICLSE